MMRLTRRGVMGGLIAGWGVRALAEAPFVSPLPQVRPAGLSSVPAAAVATRTAEALIAEAKLGGEVSFVLADLKTGAVLAERQGGRRMPPASTAKAITALYALDRLGAGHRFATRILATGPVSDGRVRGDLILAGGGDPTLSTDHLGDMAARLAALGVKLVEGRFCVWAGALPYLDEIDRDQPEWLGYNPAVSGLNLNFNRVNFKWKPVGGDYETVFDAEGERFVPPVHVARMKVVARDLPVYTYAQSGTVEDWTVSRAALGKGGSRWLPVRRPDLYAGDVFRTLVGAHGIDLPAPEVLADLPDGAELLRREGEPLPDVLRDMLKFSTNLTAEAVGMAASLRSGVGGHAASAAAMGDWLRGVTGGNAAHFVDHSGLGGASRVTALEMAGALRQLGPAAGLGAILKPVKFKDAADLGAGRAPQRVVAKTGTLNFVSGLVGYLTTAAGEERVFAIHAADVARRDAVPMADRERPPGASGWAKRARRMQLRLLGSWA